MPRLTGTVVFRLAAAVTGLSALVVLGSSTALWLVERNDRQSTVHSFADSVWWALTTLTTTGYGDHVPVTPLGRLIGAGVMVTGVGVIGAVAAVIALAVTLRLARQEELAFEAEAETLEQRLELRLARIEALLVALDARLETADVPPRDPREPGEQDNPPRTDQVEQRS